MLGVHTPDDLRNAPARRRESVPISSMTPRPESARRLTGYDVIASVLVPIRIRCHNKIAAASQLTGCARVRLEPLPTFMGVLCGTPNRVWDLRPISLNIVGLQKKRRYV